LPAALSPAILALMPTRPRPKKKRSRTRAKRASKVTQPHDRLIRFAFSKLEHAAGLLRAALPAEIIALTLWGTLRLEAVHYVDRALRGRYADLLFSAEVGEEKAYFYVLIEHQRKVERFMVLRMGAYMFRQWERLAESAKGGELLPPIVPMLIHQSDTGWTAATAFQDILQTTEATRAVLLPHVPCFRIRLCDLSRGRASGLVEEALTALGRVVLWCLSVARDDERLVQEIGALGDALDAVLAHPTGLDALRAILIYLAETHPGLGAPRIAGLLEKTAKKRQKVMKDALDELRQEGRLEGRVEGRVEGHAELLLKLLAARFGRVPAETRARILAASEATVTRWSIRVLTAPTIEAVLRSPSGKAVKKAAPAARAR
jgi:predicted transposase YdaD